MSDVVEIFPAYEEYLQPARFKVAYGGRGSGKTRTFCSILTNNVLYYGWRVVCFREIMESIAESVYQEFVAEIERRNLGEYFNILKTHIECPGSGGVIKFSGIKANQKNLNSQKLKGFSDFDAAWLEEANPVSKDSWNALIPTMRKHDSEIWVSFNPENPLEETYKRFVSDRIYPDYKDDRRYCIVKKINYIDNPRLPKELRDDLELMRDNDPELFRHIYGGEPVANSDLAIIKTFWFDAAIDAHKKLGFEAKGAKRIGFDVADSGADKCAVVYAHGSVIQYADMWKAGEDELLKSCTKVYNMARDRSALITYDSIGVGATAGAKFAELNQGKTQKVQYAKFNAGASVHRPESFYSLQTKNKDMFSNLKAQSWWIIADRFRNTYTAITTGQKFPEDQLISISSDLPYLELLKNEICTPKRDYDNNGKVKVESKKDLAKRDIPSPNIADAAIMAFAPGIMPMMISNQAIANIANS